MARKKAIPEPPGKEDLAAIATVLRDAEQPLDAVKVAKLAATSRRVKTVEVQSILEKLVADGSLFCVPPKTAKGKPKYWGRDPKIVLRQKVLEIVDRSEEPLSAKDIRNHWPATPKPDAVEIASTLAECVDERTTHEVPPKTPKGGPRYWKVDALEFARRCLIQQLRDTDPQTAAALRKTVKWMNDAAFEGLLSELAEQQQVFRHPPVGSSKKTLFGSHPPSPDPYLAEIQGRFTAVLTQLRAAAVPAVELRQAVMRLLERAGLSIEADVTVPPEQTSQAKSPGEDLVALMKQIEPGAARGALVTARMLREASQLAKAEFDAIVLQLARQDILALHEHDFAASLSPADRDELVTDGYGSYYVGMALVQG